LERGEIASAELFNDYYTAKFQKTATNNNANTHVRGQRNQMLKKKAAPNPALTDSLGTQMTLFGKHILTAAKNITGH